MIKQFNNFIENLIKPECDLVLENLLSSLQKRIFMLYYVEKISKSEIQKQLNISKYKLDQASVVALKEKTIQEDNTPKKEEEKKEPKRMSMADFIDDFKL